LIDAAKSGLIEEVKSLLRDHPDLDVNWENHEVHSTALHVASNDGHVEVVKLLLAHPVINVNLRDKFGRTAFLLGCFSGEVSVVQLLLRDPRVDVALADHNDRTPLWWAAGNGYHDLAEWLLASGRDLGDFYTKGKWCGKESTVLEIAGERNESEAVDLLERFVDNQAQTRHEIRQKLNVTGRLLSLFP